MSIHHISFLYFLDTHEIPTIPTWYPYPCSCLSVSGAGVLVVQTDQGGSRWPQAQECLHSPHSPAPPLLMADGHWCQVVHVQQSQVPNSPDLPLSYPLDHAGGWKSLLQGSPQYYGNALVGQLLVHSPGPLHLDCLPWVADAAFRKQHHPCLFYFQGYPLPLGSPCQNCDWQQPCLYPGPQCSC